MGDLVGKSMVWLPAPPCTPDHVGEGGGGRKLAKDIGFLGRGLRDRLIVFRTGLVGGLGSRCFGIDSSHLEVLIELDLAICDDPDSNNDPLGLELTFREDGDALEPILDSSLSLHVELVTCILRVVELSPSIITPLS